MKQVRRYLGLIVFVMTVSSGCCPMGPVIDTARHQNRDSFMDISIGGSYHDALNRSVQWFSEFEPDSVIYVTDTTLFPRKWLSPYLSAVEFLFGDENSFIVRATLPPQWQFYPDNQFYCAPTIQVGKKFYTDWPVFNMALRTEVAYPHILIVTPMIGFATGYEGYEIVTLGVQLSPTLQYNAFVNFHPLRNLHLYAGFAQGYGSSSVTTEWGRSGGWGDYREFYAGIGYTLNIKFKEQ